MQRPVLTPYQIIRQQSGFTLIELMVAIVVVAILAAVAFPSYLNSVRKSRRSEAISALTWIQQAEERYRANCTTYSNTLAAPNGPCATAGGGIGPPPAGSGYYTYTIDYTDAPGGTAYIASATANVGTSQAADANCYVMSLQILAGAVSYGSYQAGSGPPVPPAAPPNNNLADSGKCWSR
ncbi:MAG: prepilin-type N-terminal cleavage/methylation domain-containing protein [Sphingomonadales bacterium]|nr:prepilin-type N-terminal cleavage/methylation domain-containing protein [Sphingomonadales bacterium]